MLECRTLTAQAEVPGYVDQEWLDYKKRALRASVGEMLIEALQEGWYGVHVEREFGRVRDLMQGTDKWVVEYEVTVCKQQEEQ